jgi:Histidine kinase-, DNA gyrase B-, and HSP90-like ATPase
MKFTYNPRIIKQLGSELITRDSIAISELVKNSYDAHCKKICLALLSNSSEMRRNKHHFINPLIGEIEDKIAKLANEKIIVVEDDGDGMGTDTIKDGFFKVGTDIKIEERKKPNLNEMILGNKGLGRLSAQRISPVLVLETTSIDDEYIHVIVIEWEKFIKDGNYDAPETKYQKKGQMSYTRLWLLEDKLKEERINFSKYIENKEIVNIDAFGKQYGKKTKKLVLEDSLASSLNFIFFPFSKDNLAIDLVIYFNDKVVDKEISVELLNLAELEYSFSIVRDHDLSDQEVYFNFDLKLKPWFLERIHLNQIGSQLFNNWKKEHDFYNKLILKYLPRYKSTLRLKKNIKDFYNPPKDDKVEKEDSIKKYIDEIKKLIPIEGKIYSFKRQNNLLSMAIGSSKKNSIISHEVNFQDAKDYLNANNGIRLYRNKFRIASLGDKDNDWLKLQQKKTAGQQYYRFELNSVIGYIMINDNKQEYIKETSSREGLIDNKTSEYFTNTIDNIVNDIFYKMTKSAVLITKDILKEEHLIPKKTSKEMGEKLDDSERIVRASMMKIKDLRKHLQIIDNNIELRTEKEIEAVKKIYFKLIDDFSEIDNNLLKTVSYIQSQKEILQINIAEKKRIETEIYNNYKLMANGLITEVITHELHSLVGSKNKQISYEKYLDNIVSYFKEANNYEFINENVNPLKKDYERIIYKIEEVDKFYSFLEKTFIYKGTIDDYVNVNLRKYIDEFQAKFSSSLKKNRIELYCNFENMMVCVPKGSLIHVFFNLFDNSIYWIKKRVSISKYDKTFITKGKDGIFIDRIDSQTIHFYDTGTGIFKEYENILFHPLVSGKEKGRGMGLYIIKRFLESFDASIELLEDRNFYGNRYIFEIKLQEANND